MRRQFLFGTVVAAAMAVGVSAQSTSPSYPQSSRGQSVTVTGCVQKGDSSGAAGTTGTTTPSTTASSTTSSSGDFVLTNVSPASSGTTAESTTTPNPTTTSPTTTSPTTGSTAGTSGSSSMGASSWANGLKLSASASEDLSKFVNHKVEVKGTIENASSSMAGSATPSTTADPSASASSSSSRGSKPTLRVSSIREIGDSCSAQ